MQPDPTRDDVAFLRRISDAAQNAPLLGGRYLVLWGVLLPLAYFGQYAILARVIDVPHSAILVLWAVVMAMAGLAMHAFGKQTARKPGAGTVGNQVERWVWFGVGLGLFSYAIGAFGAVALADAPVLLFDLIIAVALVGYGAAFLVSAKMSGTAWLTRPAAGAFGGAAIVPFFAGSPTVYIIAAFIVLAVVLVPGIVLLQAEPAALPEEA